MSFKPVGITHKTQPIYENLPFWCPALCA